MKHSRHILTETCSECPASEVVSSDRIYCRDLNEFRDVKDEVCKHRRRFEILRNKVRQLQRENKNSGK